MLYKFGYNADSREVFIIDSGNVPPELVNLGSFDVPLITEVPTPNHTLYHKIRDLLYTLASVKDMRGIIIHIPGVGTAPVAAMTLSYPEPTAAWTGREYVWQMNISNIDGALTMTRSGQSEEVELVWDAGAERFTIPQNKLVDGMFINTGTIVIGDDRGPAFTIKPRAIIVSDVDYQPNYDGGYKAYGRDPFDNSATYFARQSGRMPPAYTAFSPVSLMKSPDDLMQRFALTVFGETGLTKSAGIPEDNQRSEISETTSAGASKTYAFGSDIWIFYPKFRLRNLSPLKTMPYWRIPIQIHNSGVDYSPQFALELRDDAFHAIGRVGAATPSANPPELPLGTFDRALLDDGEFHTVLLHYKASSTGDGAVEMWVGDYLSNLPMQKVIDQVGINVGYATRAAYVKRGLYFGHNKLASAKITAMTLEVSKNVLITNRMSLISYVNNPMLEDDTFLKPKFVDNAALNITGDFSPGGTISFTLPQAPGATEIAWALRSSGSSTATGNAVATGNAAPGATITYTIPDGVAGRYYNAACHPNRVIAGTDNRGSTLQSAGFGPVVDATAILPILTGLIDHTGDGSVFQKSYVKREPTYPNGTPAPTRQWYRVKKDGTNVATAIAGATGAEYVHTADDINHEIRCGWSVNAKSVHYATRPGRVKEAMIFVQRDGDLTGWVKPAGQYGDFDLVSETGLKGYDAPLTPDKTGIAVINLNSSNDYMEKTIPGGAIPASKLKHMLIGLDTQSYGSGQINLRLMQGSTLINDFTFTSAGKKGRRFVSDGVYNSTDGFKLTNDAPDAVTRFKLQMSGNALKGRIGIGMVAVNAEWIPTWVPTFDDGGQGVYDRTIPQFNARGWKGTLYPPANALTVSQAGHVVRAGRKGWTIGINTITDGSFLTYGDRSIDSALAEYDKAVTMLGTKLRAYAGTPGDPLDPPWNAADEIWFAKGIGHVCYSFGNYTLPHYSTLNPNPNPDNTSAQVTAYVDEGNPRVMRFASASSTIPDRPRVGSSLYGDWVEAADFRASIYADLGLARDGLPVAKIVSVTADGLQATMDRDITITTVGKTTRFINDHEAFYEQQFKEALRSIGVKTARATGNAGVPNMNTRCGFGDLDLALVAQGFSNSTYADHKKVIDTALDTKSSVVTYMHNNITQLYDKGNGVFNTGIDFLDADSIQAQEYAQPFVDNGSLEILSMEEYWVRDYNNSVPVVGAPVIYNHWVLPKITSLMTAEAPEGTLVSMTLTSDQTGVSWRIVGGPDVNAGALIQNGKLNFTLPTFNEPASGVDNIYKFLIRCTNAEGYYSERMATITATDVAGTAPTEVIRNTAVGGTFAFNKMDTTNDTNWSFINHDVYYLDKETDYLEISVPLFTLERAGSSTVLETMLPRDYDFTIAVEFDPANPTNGLANSTVNASNTIRLNTAQGSPIYNYVAGVTTDIEAKFVVTLPYKIPKGAPVRVIIGHESVFGRTEAAAGRTVTNQRICRGGLASSFMGRKAGTTGSKSSIIGQVATRTAYSNHNSSQSGIATGLGIGSIRTKKMSNEPSIVINGNSIPQGANDGSSFSGTAGDAGGDLKGNIGWAAMLCGMIDLPFTNISRGSDKDSYRLVTNNNILRLAYLAKDNPSAYIDMDAHNDIPGAATSWAAATEYATLYSTRRANGNGYLLTKTGTSAASGAGPAGTTAGETIVDGTCEWTYIGPDDMGTGSQLGIAWVGVRKRRLVQDKAALPNTKFFGVTMIPDAAPATETAGNGPYVASTVVSYDSTTGNLVLNVGTTIAGKIEAGTRYRLKGLSPSGLQTSGVGNGTITAVDKTAGTVTMVRPTGLAAPTGTPQLSLNWVHPDLQVPAANYGKNNSYRSWVNRFLRSDLAKSILGYEDVIDFGKTLEHNNPVTAATETGVFRSYIEDYNGVNIPRGSSITNDGTHPTSIGAFLAATDVAANTNLVAKLKTAT